MEAKRREAEGKEGGGPAGAATSPDDWRMSGVDRDPMFGIEGADSLTVYVGAPRWVGGRATVGVTKGKVRER